MVPPVVHRLSGRRPPWPLALPAALAAALAASGARPHCQPWLAGGGHWAGSATPDGRAALRSGLRRARGGAVDDVSTDLADLADELEELLLRIESGSEATLEDAEEEEEKEEEAEYEEAEQDFSAAEVVAAPATAEAAAPPPGEQAADADGELQLAVQTVGLQMAPADLGTGLYLVTKEQLGKIVDMKVQKLKASIIAMERYTSDLESDLFEKEEQLELAEARLREEIRLRAAAEQERDSLMQKRSALEAQFVQVSHDKKTAEEEFDEIDRRAEEIARRLSLGEITEEEAELEEEELMRAEARRLAARESYDESREELQEVTTAVEEASERAGYASEGEVALQEQLVAMQEQVERLKAEKDSEAQKREEADARFNQLIQRIQAKVASSKGGGE
uniref:Uncharacterized protein n=1 Tax=Alexandrium monilatum TaxID=311494 RepID=A0A7S4W046_9DINO